MKNNLKKFKKHYQNRGLLYAIFRGVKYFFYVIKKINIRENERIVIQRGDLKLDCGNGRVHIYWKGLEVTKDVGLNTSVYILYRWHDSSQADWWVEKVNQHNVVIKNRWHNVPISQTWYLFLSEDNKIIWNIQMEVEENLIIDEKRAGVMVSDRYKRWINSYEEGKFPRVNNNWQEIGLKFLESKCIGVKGLGEEKNSMPALFFDFSNSNVYPLPYIQNAPENIGARMLQARIFNSKEYKSGSYNFFSGEIILKDDEKEVETYIEKFRRNVVEKISRSKTGIKVLLANIPWQKDGRWGVRAGSRWPHLKDSSTEKEYLPFPFFLAYTASLLKENNINAILIDAIALGIREEKFLKQLEFHKPDLLIAETSTPSLRNDLEILKKINKDTKIALCGPDINIRSPNFLHQNPYIDYVLIGEYEYTALDLVKHLQKDKNLENVLGVIYSEDGKTKVNPPRPLCNLDDLPWPLREGLPMYKYWDLPGDLPYPSVQMISSRGCPFRCNFCLWPQVMYNSNKYRVRNPQDVVDEMEYLIKKKGFKSIFFDDDTWNIGRERIFKICHEIKKRGLQNIPWAIMARPDLMDREILTELKSAGLYSIKYGVESAVQKLIDNCGKDMDLKKAEDMIRFTKDLGIKVHLTFTFGLPGETEETIDQSIRKALELDPTSVQFSITTPYPGTEYFEILDKKGQIITKDWSKYDGNYGSVIETDNLNALQLQKAKERAYLVWGKHLQRRILKEDIFNIRKYYRKLKFYIKTRGIIFSLKKSVSFIFFIIRYKYLNLRSREIGNKVRKRMSLDLKGVIDGCVAYKGPKKVEIDVTNECNNSCIGCWIHSPLLKDKYTEGPRRLSLKVIKKMIDQMKNMGVEEIRVSGEGEPFMHPDIIKILEYIKQKGLKCNVITSMSLVNEKMAKKLVDLNVDLITASIWAGDEQTYLKTHPNQDKNSFIRIKRILKLIYELKKQRKKVKPCVKIYNVISAINYDHLGEMVDFALDVGSNFLEFQLIDVIPGKTDSLSLTEEHRKSIEEQIYNFKNRADFFNYTGKKKSSISLEKLTESESIFFINPYDIKENNFSLTERGKFKCPKGEQSIEERWENENFSGPENIILPNLAIKFPFESCKRCKNRHICHYDKSKNSCKINFLILIGCKTFLRRLSTKNLALQGYDKEIIDQVPCFVGWLFARILSNGNVVPCCKLDKFSLGNVYEKSFKEIWYSGKYNRFRYKIKNRKDYASFFSRMGCFKICDNLGENLIMYKQFQEAMQIKSKLPKKGFKKSLDLKSEIENIYEQRSSFRILYESIKNYGYYYTFKRVASYIKSGNYLNNYLDILGIFDGSYAYKGPFHVQIDLTNNCNNNCIACWCNSPLLEEKKMDTLTKREYLPYELVKELIDELSQMGIKEIYYSGGGEPFKHPEFMPILEYTRKKDLICHIHTNFTLLTREKIKQIIDLGIRYIVPSIWAGTAETYDATHPNKTKDTFYKIEENLKLLNSLKNELPYVKLYNVIFNMNYHEINEMINFALRTKSDAVEFTVVDTIPGKTDRLMLNKSQWEELLKKCNIIKKRLDKNFCLDNQLYLFRFDQFLRRISDETNLRESKYDKNIIDQLPCYIGWLYARILPDGDVNPCLKAHRFPTGNLYQDRFSEIWNGKLQRRFREKSLCYKKDDSFFRLIGNDPDTKEAGCYKCCDDIGRNLHMHKKIMSLTPVELGVLHSVAKYKRFKRNLQKGKSRGISVNSVTNDNVQSLMVKGILNGRKAFKGPKHIVIDLTNRCNQRCIGCWLYSPLLKEKEDFNREWLKKELDVETVKSLIDELTNLGAEIIRYTGGGEPFVHPHIMEILQYTKKKGIKTAITTNFSAIDKERIQQIVKLDVDELAISLWAASSKIYQDTHPRTNEGVFEEIVKNLGYLANVRNTKPSLTLCNVITNVNYKDIFSMYKFAKKFKVENIYYTVVDVIKDSTDRLMLSREERDIALDLAKKVKKWNDTQSNKDRINLHYFDGFLRRLSTDYGKEGNYDKVAVDSLPCYVGWYFARIMADGTVAPCCRGVKKPMGNINREAFGEIWFSKRYNEFRCRAKNLSKTHSYFKDIGCIKECDNLMHNEKIHRMVIGRNKPDN